MLFCVFFHRQAERKSAQPRFFLHPPSRPPSRLVSSRVVSSGNMEPEQRWPKPSSPPLRLFSSVEEYVEKLGGKRVIKRVLVANNGIAAVKGIRFMRRWAYEMFGDEKAVAFVAMATPEDIQANAEYIRMADQFEEVPGGSNNNNYANVQLIVQLAVRNNCQAVWAGWGHASENPRLPRTLLAAGISWVLLLSPPSSSPFFLPPRS